MKRLPTKYLTVSAMLVALGVILLGVGALVDVLDLTVAALTSLLCIWAVIEMGGIYPWIIWGLTAFLSILLLPQKTPGFFYLFIGIYPMLKQKLERLPRVPEWILKIAVFHALIALCWLIFKLFIPDEAAITVWWLAYGLALASALIYDYALTKLITYYLLVLQKRIGLKKKK